MQRCSKQLSSLPSFYLALSRNGDFELPLLSVPSLLLNHMLSAAVKSTVQLPFTVESCRCSLTAEDKRLAASFPRKQSYTLPSVLLV